MIASLRLEVFTPNPNRTVRLGGDPRAPWVAHVTGLDQRGRFVRSKIHGDIDYSAANSVGSRGVYRYYHLRPDRVYEVCRRKSWAKTELYYCYVTDGGIKRVSREDVLELMDRNETSIPALYLGYADE